MEVKIFGLIRNQFFVYNDMCNLELLKCKYSHSLDSKISFRVYDDMYNLELLK